MVESRGLEDTDHIEDTFEVQTVEEEHEFLIATDYKIHFNENGPSILAVWGDDDFEDGSIELRSFNLNHVIDFGWV